MSYILEALTKSEQARNQAAAPRGASLMPVLGVDAAERRVWPYVLCAVLALNAVFIWLHQSPAQQADATARHAEAGAIAAARAPEPEKSALAPEAATPAPVRVNENERSARPKPVATLHAQRSAPPAANAVEAQVKPKQEVALQRLRVAQPEAQLARSAARAGSAKPTPIAAPALAAVAPGTNAATARSLAEPPNAPRKLAESAPADLPPMAVSGFIRDGGKGMVIVNDKLLREGEEIEPGLKLEKILDDGLVFDYKGQRIQR